MESPKSNLSLSESNYMKMNFKKKNSIKVVLNPKPPVFNSEQPRDRPASLRVMRSGKALGFLPCLQLPWALQVPLKLLPSLSNNALDEGAASLGRRFLLSTPNLKSLIPSGVCLKILNIRQQSPLRSEAGSPALELTAEGEEQNPPSSGSSENTRRPYKDPERVHKTLWSHFTGLKFHYLAEFIPQEGMGTRPHLSAVPSTPGRYPWALTFQPHPSLPSGTGCGGARFSQWWLRAGYLTTLLFKGKKLPGFLKPWAPSFPPSSPTTSEASSVWGGGGGRWWQVRDLYPKLAGSFLYWLLQWNEGISQIWTFFEAPLRLGGTAFLLVNF